LRQRASNGRSAAAVPREKQDEDSERPAGQESASAGKQRHTGLLLQKDMTAVPSSTAL
ncbi:hypothetical protein M9458_026087, partial [Cirrhinus mrigala]